MQYNYPYTAFMKCPKCPFRHSNPRRQMHRHYAGLSAFVLSDAKHGQLHIEGKVLNFKCQGLGDAQFTDATANGPMISEVPFFVSVNTDGVSC